MTENRWHRESLEHIRANTLISMEPFPRMGTLWVVRLRKTEPELVNLYVADHSRDVAFEKLVAMVRKEEERYAKKAEAEAWA